MLSRVEILHGVDERMEIVWLREFEPLEIFGVAVVYHDDEISEGRVAKGYDQAELRMLRIFGFPFVFPAGHSTHAGHDVAEDITPTWSQKKVFSFCNKKKIFGRSCFVNVARLFLQTSS